MAYEKLEPHGRLTVAGADFAWEFYWRTSRLNNDENGNAVASPILVHYQLIMLATMSSGETRRLLIKSMRLNEESEDLTELMRWNLWCMDYFLREVALSYGTKPRSALVVARDGEIRYKEGIISWINHFRTRKTYHVVPSLVGTEKKVNGVIRRLTGAYPRDFQFEEEMFPIGSFKNEPRAIVACKFYFQLFLPGSGCVCEVTPHRVAFWRTPSTNDEAQGEEQLQKIRLIKLLKRVEHHEDEHCEIVGLDLYPANLSAYFLLPKDVVREDGTMLNVIQALIVLERKLDGRKLHNYVQKMLPQRTKRTTEMVLTMPCFKVHTVADLEQPIRNMGLEILFDRKNLDWTNLFVDMKPDGSDFYLSSIKQDIEIQMTPTSTASTYWHQTQPKKKSVPADWSGRQMTLNRPFLFFIYDHFSRVILSIGRVQNPCDKREQ